jgi:hypothetical protein
MAPRKKALSLIAHLLSGSTAQLGQIKVGKRRFE